MSGQVWLSDEQVERLMPYVPTLRGKPRVDDRRVSGGILFVLRNGLRWQDALAVHGPHKILYNRFARWSRLGVFARIVRGFAKPGTDGDTIMMGIEPVVRHQSKDRRRGHLKAHRTAASLRRGGCARARLGARRAA